MAWDIDFISYEDFRGHVSDTIAQYKERLEPYDLKKFNKNIVDPIKLVFDKNVYQKTWEELISNEIFRQRDKSNSNEIGYFHQNIFKYIKGCQVPAHGWDVIFTPSEGYRDEEGGSSTIYVEMKNKFNTMNSSSSAKTFMRMQNQLLQDNDCECFLVEAIAKRSQNVPWQCTLDGEKVKCGRIRRVSIDKFYTIVTGEERAFFSLCMALPEVIKNVLEAEGNLGVKSPHDTVFSQLEELAKQVEGYSDKHEATMNTAMLLAIYMLGFETYEGFAEMFRR